MGVTIKVTDEAGEHYDIQWEDHHTLLETLQANGVPVLATCGGNASCATCHAFIDPEHYAASGERTEAEQDLLDMVDDVANEYSRLCCQVEYAPGMDGAEIGSGTRINHPPLRRARAQWMRRVPGRSGCRGHLGTPECLRIGEARHD